MKEDGDVTHNVRVFVLIENVQCGPECSTQDRRVLCTNGQRA